MTSRSTSATAVRPLWRVDAVDVPGLVDVGVVAVDQGRPGRPRAGVAACRVAPARRRRRRRRTCRPGTRRRSARCRRTRAGCTTWAATPAARGRSNWVASGCHRSGSGSSRQRMWLSTRSVPGTLRKKPTTPCAPGAAPGTEADQAGRRGGREAGGERPGGRPAASVGQRRARSGAASGSRWCPSPSTSSTTTDRTSASAPAGQAERVGGAGHAERGEHAGHDVGQAGLAVAGSDRAPAPVDAVTRAAPAGAAGWRCPGTGSAPAAASSNAASASCSRSSDAARAPGRPTTRTPWICSTVSPALASSAVADSASKRRRSVSRSPARPSGSAQQRRGQVELPADGAGQHGRRPGWPRARSPRRPGAASRRAPRPPRTGESTTSSTLWQSTRSASPGSTRSASASASPCTARIRSATPGLGGPPGQRGQRVRDSASTTVTSCPAWASGTAKPPVPPPTSTTLSRGRSPRPGRSRAAAPPRPRRSAPPRASRLRSCAPRRQPIGHSRRARSLRASDAHLGVASGSLGGTRFSRRRGCASDGADGLPEDGEVGGERPVLDVVEVEPDAVLPGQVGASADLPQSGHARLDQQPAGHVLVVPGDLGRQRRPRPDQAHVALEHVDQLRQLVQRPLAQERADPGDPRVAAHLEQQAVALVVLGELARASRRRRPPSSGT